MNESTDEIFKKTNKQFVDFMDMEILERKKLISEIEQKLIEMKSQLSIIEDFREQIELIIANSLNIMEDNNKWC